MCVGHCRTLYVGPQHVSSVKIINAKDIEITMETFRKAAEPPKPHRAVAGSRLEQYAKLTQIKPGARKQRNQY